MATINLSQLYNQAFGFTMPPPYGPLPTGVAVRPGAAYDGLPVPVPATGKEGLYGTVIALPCTIEDFELPNEPLIEISGTKLIVETPIDGNDGTFKELYSTGDYAVTIRGLLINEDDPDNYPEDLVRQLRSVVEIPRHVKVTNALTTLFNITHLAIRSYTFSALEGAIGVQVYELNCSSDREFPLRLREK